MWTPNKPKGKANNTGKTPRFINRTNLSKKEHCTADGKWWLFWVPFLIFFSLVLYIQKFSLSRKEKVQYSLIRRGRHQVFRSLLDFYFVQSAQKQSLKMKLKNFLLEIPVADWPVLRDMYTDNWPSNYSTYFAIDNGIKLKQMDPVEYNKEVQMYSLNGDWSDGTFILLVSKHEDYCLKSINFPR